jgi:hypothetical protein
MRQGYKTSPRVGVVYDETCRWPQGCAFDMSKKYELVRDKIPLPGGGFFEAFRMALVDISCFGEGHRLDITGYPHETEAGAMASDWAALGVDLMAAADSAQLWVGQCKSEEEGGSDGQRGAGEAVKESTSTK